MTEALSGCSYNECSFDIEQAVTATGHLPGDRSHNKSKVGVYVFRLQCVLLTGKLCSWRSGNSGKAVAQSLY